MASNLQDVFGKPDFSQTPAAKAKQQSQKQQQELPKPSEINKAFQEKKDKAIDNLDLYSETIKKNASKEAQAVLSTPEVDAEGNEIPNSSVFGRLDEIRNKLADLREQRPQIVKSAEWAQVAETIGHALVQVAAGAYGMRTGLDLSGAKFNPTDWEARISNRLAVVNSNVNDLLKEQAQLKGIEKETRAKALEDAKSKIGTQELRTKGRVSQLESERKEALKRAEPARKFKNEILRLDNPEDPNQYVLKLVDNEGTVLKDLGTIEKPLSVGVDPHTGEMFNKRTGEPINTLTREQRTYYQKLPPTEKKLVNDFQKQFNKEIEGLKFSRASAKKITNHMIAASMKDTTAAAALGAMLADVYEKGGRKTDQDVVRYSSRKGVVNLINDTIKEVITDGVISPEKAKDLLSSVGAYVDAVEADISERALETARQLETRGLDAEEVAKILYPSYIPIVTTYKELPSGEVVAEPGPATKSEVEYVTVRDAQGNLYKLPKTQLQDALDQDYELVK